MADDDPLDALLDQWQVAHEAGRDVAAAELCPDDPALAAELGRHLSVLRRVTRLSPHSAADTPVSSVARYHPVGDGAYDFRPGDQVAIAAELSRPAYACLLAVGPDGLTVPPDRPGDPAAHRRTARGAGGKSA